MEIQPYVQGPGSVHEPTIMCLCLRNIHKILVHASWTRFCISMSVWNPNPPLLTYSKFCSLFNCVRLLFQLPHFFAWHDQSFRKYLRFLFCVSNLMREFCNATLCLNWRPLGSSKFYVYLIHQRDLRMRSGMYHSLFNCVIWIWFHWIPLWKKTAS